MKVILFCLLALAASLDCLGQRGSATKEVNLTDTIFYDREWKTCTQEAHRYYRLCFMDSTTMPSRQVIKILDYYKNGRLQMEGFVSERSTAL